jgi:hypothetical protein
MEMMQDYLLLTTAMPVGKHLIIGVKLNYLFSISLPYRWRAIINSKAKD